MNLIRMIVLLIVLPQNLIAQTNASSDQQCNLNDNSIVRFWASQGEAILFQSRMSDMGDGNLLVEREFKFSDGREIKLPDGNFYKDDLVRDASFYEYMAFSKELIMRSLDNLDRMQDLSPKLLDALQGRPSCENDQDDRMCAMINKGYIKPKVLDPKITGRLIRENAPVISLMLSSITSTSIAYDATSNSTVVLYGYSD